jgi:UDP-N-acetylmuramate dehydrogenase
MNDMKSLLINRLGTRIQCGKNLASYTTFKIGGPAEFFISTETVDDLVFIITTVRSLGIPITILGGGSNILISDNGIRGLVIKNATEKIQIVGIKGAYRKGSSSGSVFVEAESGVPFNKLVRFTIEEQLSGLEMHLGLPGSVGGAVFMNSKWTRPPVNVGDRVHQVKVLTHAEGVKIIAGDRLQFRYGSSVFQKTGDIILSVIFRLSCSDKKILWQKANESILYRKATQPQGEKTAGCVFKNISKAEAIAAHTPEFTTSAGYLIDHAGCKGLVVGDAKISKIHANFIVNTGRAKASDVIQLMEIMKERVKDKFGVTLQEEIIRYG